MENLKQYAMSGVRWSSLASLCNGILQTALMVALSYFLSPSEFGLYAIVTVFIAFSQILVDAGIGNAVFTPLNPDKNQLSSLYWVNILSGLLLFLLLLVLAPFISSLYKDNSLTYLLRLASFCFLFAPLGLQCRFILHKNYQFRQLAYVEISSSIAQFFISMTLAVLDFGTEALIWGFVAKCVIEGPGYLFACRKLFWPQLHCRWSEVKPFLSFGAYQMAEKSIDYFSQQLDILIIGKLLSKEALGIYAFAKGIVLKPLQFLNPVVTKMALPLFTRVNDDIPRRISLYKKLVGTIATMNTPLYMLLAISASQVISLFFDSAWAAAIEPLQIFCIYAMLLSLGNPMGTLIISSGRADVGFWWNCFLIVVAAIMIAVGCTFGLIGVVYALVSLLFLLVIPAWAFIVKPLNGLPLIPYLEIIIKPIIWSIVPSVCVLALQYFIPYNGILLLIGNSCIFLVLYLLTVRVFNPSTINNGLELLKIRYRIA